MSKLGSLPKLSIKHHLLAPFKGIPPINVKNLLVKHLAGQMAKVKMQPKVTKLKGM